MKNLIAAALATLALASSAFAYNAKEVTAANDTCSKLVPTKVVNPSNLPRSFTRGTLTIEFSLDQAGTPQNVEVLSKSDRAVKEQVLKAFKQWKFDPSAASDTKRFVMPVEVVVPQA